MDYDTWKTTPPEPSVARECSYCQADLYVGCDYVHDRNNDEWYCDDNCFIEDLRDKGELVTEEVSEYV